MGVTALPGQALLALQPRSQQNGALGVGSLVSKAHSLPVKAAKAGDVYNVPCTNRQRRMHQWGARCPSYFRTAALVCMSTAAGNTDAPLPIKEVCRNRKARFDYEILETVETGIQLKGTEIKCIRAGKISLQDAFCRVVDGEMIMYNSNIAKNDYANGYDNHEPARQRKLLMHKKEISKLAQRMAEKGLSIVPLKMYFKGSWLKVEIGLGRGKKNFDKRDSIKARESKRDLGRISKLQF